MTREDHISSLLKGAIDLHIHADPSFMLRTVDALEAAEECMAAGMRAIAVKDHNTSTGTAAYFANKYMHRSGNGKFDCFGSICLNNEYGYNLHAVDSALKFGVKLVYLPTVAAASHIEIMGRLSQAFGTGSSHFVPVKVKGMTQHVMRVVDKQGGLLPEVKAIIDLVKESDAVLCTGHIDYAECLEVAKYCKAIHLEKLLLTHLPTFTTLEKEKLRVITDICGFIEMNESQIAEQTPVEVRNSRQEMYAYIRFFGVEKCVIASDAGSAVFPRPVPACRRAINACIEGGFTDEEIIRMTRTNPAGLLGLNDE